MGWEGGEIQREKDIVRKSVREKGRERAIGREEAYRQERAI